jgi:hypothetical protein
MMDYDSDTPTKGKKKKTPKPAAFVWKRVKKISKSARNLSPLPKKEKSKKKLTKRISEDEGVDSSFFDDCSDFEAMLEKAQINKKESLQRLSFLDLSVQGSWAFGVDD